MIMSKEQNEILETCRKKLRHLQTILAIEGHRVDYKVIHEIEDCQKKIREIKKLFLSWGVVIEDELVDELKP
jgi:hypothetical protein